MLAIRLIHTLSLAIFYRNQQTKCWVYLLLELGAKMTSMISERETGTMRWLIFWIKNIKTGDTHQEHIWSHVCSHAKNVNWIMASKQKRRFLTCYKGLERVVQKKCLLFTLTILRSWFLNGIRDQKEGKKSGWLESMILLLFITRGESYFSR